MAIAILLIGLLKIFSKLIKKLIWICANTLFKLKVNFKRIIYFFLNLFFICSQNVPTNHHDENLPRYLQKQKKTCNETQQILKLNSSTMYHFVFSRRIIFVLLFNKLSIDIPVWRSFKNFLRH